MKHGLTEQIVKDNGGLLVTTVAQKDGTIWRVYLSKGKASRRFFVNVFKNGEIKGSFEKMPKKDALRAPEPVIAGVEYAFKNIQRLTSVDRQRPVA